MMEDAELLRRYSAEKSEEAFAELVRRHLDLVYSTALRQLAGDTHLAQDVAQTVFTALARKAASLTDRTTLTGWLYLGAHHAAAQAVRGEQRRRAREQEASIMHEQFSSSDAATDWDRVRPVLDAAMRELTDADREAVLLRYFERRPFADIGASLRLGEDAARMRVERALEKLRALLARRGVTSTAAALSAALGEGSVIAAPTGLAVVVTHAALGAVAGGTATLGGILTFMSTTQFAPTVAVVAALAAVAATIHNVRENRAAEIELAAATQARAVALTRLGEMQRRATPRSANALPQSASAPRAPVRLTVGRDPAMEEAGRQFLATHPEAQALIDRQVRQMFEGPYGRTLRAMGFSPEERERIAAAAVNHMGARINTGGMTFVVGTNEAGPLDEGGGKLNEILGDADFRRFAEVQAQDKVQAVVRAVVAASSLSDSPVTAPQAKALVDLIAQQTTVRPAAATFSLLAPNWKAISEEAAGVLSGSQLELFRAAVTAIAPREVMQMKPRS